jgi:uncharacterized FlaG/YvyC family protein
MMFDHIEEVEEQVVIPDYKEKKEAIQEMLDTVHSTYGHKIKYLNKNEHVMIQIVKDFGEMILKIYDDMPKSGTYVRIKE